MVYLSWASESNFVNFHVFCNCHSCCWSISWYQVYNTWWKTSLENTHRHKKYNCKPLTLITCLLDLELIRKVDMMKDRKDGAKIKNVPLIYMYMYTARSNNYSFPLIPSRENIWTFQWYTKQSTNDVGTTVKFRQKAPGRGGSRISFRRGCTRLLLYFNINKPHSFFFLAEYQLY